MKPKRIFTYRYPDGKSWEAIELHSNGYYFWTGGDELTGIDFQFPACYYSIKELFKLHGREFIPDKDSHDY